MDILRARWPHLLVAVLGILLLGPMPIPRTLIEPLQAARESLHRGRPDSVLAALETALAFEPSLSSLHLPAARAALAAGLPATALQHLRALEPFRSAQPSQVCLEGLAWFQLGELEAAVALWRSAPDTCLTDVSILERLETAYRLLGDTDNVVSTLERLHHQAPGNPAIARRLGLLLATSDPDRALPYLRRAAESGDHLSRTLVSLAHEYPDDGDRALLLTRIGQALGQAGEWQLAAAAFRQALSLEPRLHEARAYLGLALDRSGSDGEADLLAAAAAYPESPLPRLFLGLHYRHAGQPQRALQELARAAALDPNNPALLAETAATYEALGDLAAAKAAYRAAAELAPTQADFWLLLAEFALSHEIEVEALALPAARNAAALDQGNPLAFSALGYAHYLAGRPHLAERCLRRALSLQPLDARLQLRWGLLRHSQGDLPGAIAALTLASQLDPSGPIGILARRTAEGIAPR